MLNPSETSRLFRLSNDEGLYLLRAIHIAAQKDGDALFASLAAGASFSLEVKCLVRKETPEEAGFIGVVDVLASIVAE